MVLNILGLIESYFRFIENDRRQIEKGELSKQSWELLNEISLIPIGSLIWRLIARGELALFNLEIKKKRRSNTDLNIHHSKVFSSEQIKIK